MLTHNFLYVNITNVVSAGLSELADEADSKSVGGNIVRVQVPQPALNLEPETQGISRVSGSFFYAIKKL